MTRNLRVCAVPNCPTFTRRSQCDTHTRQREQARGTRQQRGYDRAHDRERKRWLPRVEAGLVKCWRCGQQIPPGQPFDLGHDDRDRSRYAGPEHPACNRATGAHR